MSLLKAFTTQLKNLIIELSEVLPYNKEISVNKTTIELLIRTNPRLVLNAFNIYILPYKREIIDCDDNFFLSQDIRESENVNKQLVGTLNILRNYWSSLTESTKKSVWLYFAVLIRISEKITLMENAV
tara:strand:+ start:800 stop:1183 length:384 start_codon:yes stop_codon:yes gene_type:complete